MKTARRYRTIEIKLGDHTIKAADPLPDDLAAVRSAIKTCASTAGGAHPQ